MKKKERREDVAAEELSLLPVMSLLIILIPFLVGNVAFMHFKAISVQTPGASAEAEPEVKKDKDKNVMLSIKILESVVDVQLVDEDTAKMIHNRKIEMVGKDSLDSIRTYIEKSLNYYPKLNTALVRVEGNPKYKSLIEILDAAKVTRNGDAAKAISVVLLPKGTL